MHTRPCHVCCFLDSTLCAFDGRVTWRQGLPLRMLPGQTMPIFVNAIFLLRTALVSSDFLLSVTSGLHSPSTAACAGT